MLAGEGHGQAGPGTTRSAGGMLRRCVARGYAPDDEPSGPVVSAICSVGVGMAGKVDEPDGSPKP